jgi:cyanate lyase
MTKREAGEHIQAAMRAREVTFAQVAAALDRPPVWTAAAILGQHPFSSEEVAALYEVLPNLEPGLRDALTQIPTRGALDAPVPTDATIYRLYEVIQVYGPALKALIHEEFGDGIMSAINFSAEVERIPDPNGDRVQITLNGKFLPYQWG